MTAPVAVFSSFDNTTMPNYQVIRSVDIVCEVEADNEDGAIEEALEEECAGKAEFCEQSIEVINLDKPKGKAGRVYRVYAMQAQVSLIKARSEKEAVRIFMEESPRITGTNTCVLNVRLSKDREKDQHITISESADL